jgi:DNA topoisomerase I
VRLHRSKPGSGGYARSRHGRGFAYADRNGRKVTDAATLRRIKSLVIPPAWKDVWISADPIGHIQATGVDVAGRTQYLYHPDWRRRRDRSKFTRVLEDSAALAGLRRQVARDIAVRGFSRRRALALAVRLIDKGLFRVGEDRYAEGDEPTYGMRPSNVVT